MENAPKEENPRNGRRPFLRGPNLWLLVLVVGFLALLLLFQQGQRRSTIDYSFFLEQLDENNIAEVSFNEKEATGSFREAPQAPPVYDDNKRRFVQPVNKAGKERMLEKHFRTALPGGEKSVEQLLARLEATKKEGGKPLSYNAKATGDNAMMIFYMVAILLPIGFFLFLFISYRRAQNQMMGGGFLSGFAKSPAKRYEGVKQPITFKDVAGLEGVKNDLNEIVEYLKNPERFQRLGGRVPKGVLLNGPPGTGKTLLARAVAGEADVPYFSVSGSEFIQMFVGVGASRVRDLFKTAKDSSPSIIFIDEIDAVGRQRGAGLGGGHDEREQTLNQILSEMDGFTQTESVIVLAATNRPDVLDPALLRPGRFDRHITVGRPTMKGRKEIFQVHVRDVPLSDEVDLSRLAASTTGLTGADIRNIVNEAALWAARQNKTKVEPEDFEYAMDKIQMGAKREEVLGPLEKEKTAYHESGHALLAWSLPGSHPVHKVTIIPRGRALGVTLMRPGEDRMNMSESELRDHLTVMLGGRAAEKLVYDETTVGAENDLERATGLARRMVTHWGMTEKLGPVSYKMSDEDPFLGRELHQQRQFSEHTMELIDDEVARILHEASQRATDLLVKHRDKLDKMAQALIAEEELDEHGIARLIGPSVHPNNAETNGKPVLIRGEQGEAKTPQETGVLDAASS